ncbi:MAG: hypothetical protein ACUVTP_03375 [Candidatus Fervidibacter sp.]|uniref:hypothetical protein n=1 Tax=Candidatus Fervidibacter sp. TaxID=3100871 RepID=UPI00404AE0C4
MCQGLPLTDVETTVAHKGRRYRIFQFLNFLKWEGEPLSEPRNFSRLGRSLDLP